VPAPRRRQGRAADRYPAIAAVAAKLGARSFTLDGEAAVSGADRRRVRGAPPRARHPMRSSTHSIRWCSTASICGPLPVGDRKAKLARRA